MSKNESATNDSIIFVSASLSITVNNRPVDDKADVFVFEHILITGATNKLTKYSKGTKSTAVNQISGDFGVFCLIEAVVNNQYGAYYYAGSPADKSDAFIYVWYPELTL